jgi:hypothetical protein
LFDFFICPLQPFYSGLSADVECVLLLIANRDLGWLLKHLNEHSYSVPRDLDGSAVLGGIDKSSRAIAPTICIYPAQRQKLNDTSQTIMIFLRGHDFID